MKKFYMILSALAAMTMTATAQEVLSDELEVGDYAGATAQIEGSYWDAAPTTFYVAHTGSQMIYTADDLSAFSEEKQNIKITKLTYRFANNNSFYDIERDVKIYLQEIDATEFASVDGKKQFFDFDETSPVYDSQEMYEMLLTYGDDGEMEFDLSNNPFTINPGKGLLVTAIFDALDDSNCNESSFDMAFYTTGIRNRAMTFTNNTVSFLDYKDTEDFPDATAMLGCGTSIELPVTKISYTYQEVIPTAITDINIDNAGNGAYYDVMGRVLDGSNLPAGIYIHNGKKYIAK